MEAFNTGLDAVDAVGERLVAPLRAQGLIDRAAVVASGAGEGAAVWFGWGVLRLMADRRDAPRQALIEAGGLAATLGIESAAVNVGLKGIVRRPRPVEVARSGREFRTTSFPSGHAASSFASATFLGRPGAWGSLFGVATVVTTSRVVLGVHHLSDVLAGAVVGVGFGLLGRRATAALTRRLSQG